MNLPAGLSNFQWRYFAASDIPDILDSISGFIDGKLCLGNDRSVAGVPFDFPENGIINMYDIITPAPECDSRTVLTADFYAENDGKMLIGLGADWRWSLRFNGRMILNALRTGNSEYPVSPGNHMQEICYKRGRNQIVCEVFGGRYRHPGYNGGMDVAFKIFSGVPPLQMLYPPVALFPDAYENAVSIIFTSNRPSPAAVEYRPAGSAGPWQRCYDNLGGQRRRDIAGLDAGTSYEYRSVLLDEARQQTEIFGDIQIFRTAVPPGNTFRFTATADLQDDAQRNLFLQNMLGKNSGKNDFFVFLGDLEWTSDFNYSVMDGFIMPLRQITGNSLPLVMVRGNHEMYGMDSNKFFKYFSLPAPGREGYGMFNCGDVCFIVLDFCDDAPVMPPPSTRQYHDFEPYLAAESRWLKEAVAAPRCRDAKFRVVLAHGIPVGDGQEYMPEHIREMIDPLFGGSDPQVKIHLWLGGHVHYPFRSVPYENSCFSMLPVEKINGGKGLPPLGKNYGFPVVACGGPNPALNEKMQFTSMEIEISPEKITLRSMDRSQQVFDTFCVHADGMVIDGERSPEFKYYTY